MAQLEVRPRPLVDVEKTVRAIERPAPQLFTLYLLQMLLVFPVAPLLFLPLYFRYQTLRYRFDDDGVHASWGILFRREVSLTYARIQDIHLRRGLLERWLGIGSVQVQTASGSGGSELVIEGIPDFVAVRDFLYAKMRGATTHPTTPKKQAAGFDAEAVTILRAIKDDLAAVRATLQAKAATSAATTPAAPTTTPTTSKEADHA